LVVSYKRPKCHDAHDMCSYQILKWEMWPNKCTKILDNPGIKLKTSQNNVFSIDLVNSYDNLDLDLFLINSRWKEECYPVFWVCTVLKLKTSMWISTPVGCMYDYVPNAFFAILHKELSSMIIYFGFKLAGIK
jgi:hypothetical protein